MRGTLEPRAETAARARALAGDAASRAGVEIVDLDDMERLTQASSLIDELWGTGRGDSYLAPSHLRALTHAGNYCAGALAGGTLVGAAVGFLGQNGAEVYLHSHILGVHPAHRGGSVGFALKQHQRAWAVDRGLRRATWTFDPLVARNAYFNLHKLGASAAMYLDNFYGVMDDDINANDESDRLLVAWDLDSDGAERAARGETTAFPDPDAATVALDAGGQIADASWGSHIVCATPEDIVELRRTDPEAAAMWRRGLRTTLGVAMREGYRVVAFTRSGRYVLERA